MRDRDLGHIPNITYTVDGLTQEPIEISTRDLMYISEDMDSEVDRAACDYGFYAVLSEKAETKHQRLKFKFEQWKARTEHDELSRREAEKEKKLTEASMRSYIMSQPKYRAYQLKIIDYGERARVCKKVVDVLSARKDLLQTKCSNRRKEIRR